VSLHQADGHPAASSWEVEAVHRPGSIYETLHASTIQQVWKHQAFAQDRRRALAGGRSDGRSAGHAVR